MRAGRHQHKNEIPIPNRFPQTLKPAFLWNLCSLLFSLRQSTKYLKHLWTKGIFYNRNFGFHYSPLYWESLFYSIVSFHVVLACSAVSLTKGNQGFWVSGFHLAQQFDNESYSIPTSFYKPLIPDSHSLYPAYNRAGCFSHLHGFVA